MHEVKAIIRSQKLNAVMEALHEIPGLPGVTLSRVHAYARPQPHDEDHTPRAHETDLMKLETVVPAARLDEVVDAIREAARTGRAGDGMIFVSDVRRAVRIRTGETDSAAL